MQGEKHIVVPILSVLLLINSSCTPVSSNRRPAGDARYTRITSLQKKYSIHLQHLCQTYAESRQQQADEDYRYFETVLLPGIKENPELTDNNRRFLDALSLYLLQKNNTTEIIYTFEQPLFPVFTLEATHTGIVASAEKQNSLEQELMTELQSGQDLKPMTKSKYFPARFNRLFATRNRNIYLYTDRGCMQTSINNLGYFSNECLEYIIYVLNTQHLKVNEKALMGSTLPIDLEYGQYHDIDSLLHQRYFRFCSDCPDSRHLPVTFARPVGAPDLYFIYADSFPVNDQLDTPLRALIMQKEDGSIAYLWEESVDLFGCSCL